MGAAAEGLALQRSTNPGQLKRELAGDLDSIVMKAIDKDRHCRYASASEFAADIGRYLRDEPVLASPPGAFYRPRKFVREPGGSVRVSGANRGISYRHLGKRCVSDWPSSRHRELVLVLGPDPSDRNFTDVRSFAQAMFYTMKSMREFEDREVREDGGKRQCSGSGASYQPPQPA